MSRQKTFERNAALAAAIGAFADFGFEGTSTELLTKRMGIGRQSLYDTFGDKRQLYKEALQHYCFDSVTAIGASLQADGSPLAAIEATLLHFAERVSDKKLGGCLGLAATCEFGERDPEIAAIGNAASANLQTALEAIVRRAKALGETAPDVDPKTAALFLSSSLAGLKIAARGGATREALAAIARTAVRCLR